MSKIEATDEVTHLRALLAEQTARAERAEAEAEVLLWNLGGCGTYAQGYALDQEPAPERARPALLEVLDLARRYQSRREDYEGACLLVARMHAAAVGEVCGPAIGVVEDVAALKARAEKAEAERDAALAACAEMRAALLDAREVMTGMIGQEWADAWNAADAALSRTDLGRGWASPEVVRRVCKQLKAGRDFLPVRYQEAVRQLLADLDALLKKGGG